MLGLKQGTDRAWATAAVGDLDALLADHAHCEMKAASNAISLAVSHPGDVVLARALTDLAREELDHFQRVLSLLDARGVSLGRPTVDEYAAELRRKARELPPWNRAPVVDRLLVGALIEARSCERFKLLADVASADPLLEAPRALWAELLASEARHYRTFVDLAIRVAGGDRDRVCERLDALAELEGAIVVASARPASDALSRATIHG